MYVVWCGPCQEGCSVCGVQVGCKVVLAVGPREARVEEGKGQREENSLEERAGASVSGDLTLRPCMAVSGLARQLTATAFQVVGGSSSAVYSNVHCHQQYLLPVPLPR